MEYRTFGRTGLDVSVCGLGSGGQSRLGLGTGSTPEQAIAVVRRAVELGINYFDTAADYENEDVVGRALERHRDTVVISSKIHPRVADGSLLGPAELRYGLESSLRQLGRDFVDVYHLHRVKLDDYEHCREELVPELLALRAEGKIRFIAVSESTGSDPLHTMLRRALQDDCWDVMMVGFNLFNQSARHSVFPATIDADIAVEIMASARSHFSRPEQFTEKLRQMIESGDLDIDQVGRSGSLLFLDAVGGLEHLSNVSYRFVAHEPGVHVVLTGTGNVTHLEENVNAINAGPLPADTHGQIVALFGRLSQAVEASWRS